jgi:hypothetical protein
MVASDIGALAPGSARLGRPTPSARCFERMLFHRMAA